MKQLVILAGGKGTRLRDQLGGLPKPLIEIGGKPLLEHQIELARRQGFSEIVLFTCYRPDLIEAALGDGSRYGLRLHYQIESAPLGTAGAVLAGFEKLADQFVVLYGDTMVNVDLARVARTHQNSGAEGTLLIHPNDHPADSDLVEIDAASRITAFHNRPHPADHCLQNLVSAGLYVLNKRALRPWAGSNKPMDFGNNLFPAMLARGIHLHGYNSPEFIKDIGTPERYERVCAQYNAGIVQRSSLATHQRAVFLDRDGTLVKEVSPQGLSSPDQLELLPGVAEAIHLLNNAGLRAVVITNQPVVAKGFCTEAELKVVHNKLETLLGRDHAYLDRIYWCPHHPQKGFPGERPELKILCNCRKPRIGLIEQSVRDLSIDLTQSWFTGDATTDIQTAKNAGLRSVLVRTGYGGSDGKYSARPDFTCDSFLEAVNTILAEIST
ncbi:MAG: HAD-IIIA family hydrolase [Verrucomicrobia bacterium]|nr:HAD-IIIA family hydrolase [Verrucomicrobiota bacterium]